jgi:hypothetical protein
MSGIASILLSGTEPSCNSSRSQWGFLLLIPVVPLALGFALALPVEILKRLVNPDAKTRISMTEGLFGLAFIVVSVVAIKRNFSVSPLLCGTNIGG